MAGTVYLDAHCHLDECYDPIGTVNRARRVGAVLVAVTSSPERYRDARNRFGGLANVRVALGLHPLNVQRLRQSDIDRFGELLAGARYVGEVGLDRSREGLPSWDRQVATFQKLLQLPGATAKLWSVHTRRAESTAVPMLIAAGVPAILHWYSGSMKMLELALEAGFYFSVNAQMLGSASGLRALQAIPRDRVLTETDAPYAPIPGGSDPIAALQSAVRMLAQRWTVTAAEAQQIVFDNMARAVTSTSTQ